MVAAAAMVSLVGLVVGESLSRAGGTEVALRMEAVDPRSVLSGHYVAVDLQEPVQPGQACPPGVRAGDVFTPPWLGEPSLAARPMTWVALARRGTAFSVVAAAGDRRTAVRYAPVVVRGESFCRPPVAKSADQDAQPGAIFLNIGVDRFYVNQAEGRAIDALLSRPAAGTEGPVQAIVSIGQDGRARMKGLLVNGRRLEPNLF
jgi:uncharacterized membrane-anchored protein